MAVYYSEWEPYAAAWLRNLMKKGLIPDGEVDTRSIVDVSPSDLRGFRQAHFFAGIAGWSRALRLAGWPDDREIWTGSAPCQPFSIAGKGKGTADERHLWPVFFNLIRECRPPVVMGEQVAGSAGYGWFDGVAADLEAESYTSRAVDIPACAVDAPHIRQRLYWVALANAQSKREPSGAIERAGNGRGGFVMAWPEQWRDCFNDGITLRSDMGHADDARLQGHGRSVEQHDAPGRQEPDGCSAETSVGNMADAVDKRCDGFDALLRQEAQGRDARDISEAAGSSAGSFWDDAIWLTGADGKARRSQPGVPLLVDGFPTRASQLRAYGNAIVPPLAAEVIRAFMEAV